MNTEDTKLIVKWCGVDSMWYLASAWVHQSNGNLIQDDYVTIRELGFSDLDMNFYFKYAVPKLVKWIMGNNPDGEVSVIVYTEENFFKGLDKDPAEAFGLALLKLISRNI